MRVLIPLLLVVLGFESARSEVDWPEFRGPRGDGIANADRVPISFSQTENLKWRSDLPGRGWSSPVISGNRIWLTTAVEIFPTEAEREELLLKSGEDPKTFKVRAVAKSIRLTALEVDLDTGALKREIELTVIESPDAIHSLNSYASPTPVLNGGKLFAHFGTFGTFCVDTETGNVDWETRLPLKHAVGPGSSPVVFKDRLVLICDGVDQQYVTALNKHTGKEIWKTNRPPIRNPDGDRRKAYSTPIVIIPKGTTEAELICLGAQWLVSYDPENGAENWRLDHGSGFSVVPRPVFSEKEQLIFFSTGFGKPELWAASTKGELIWKDPKRIPARPSPLLVDGVLYVITDGGVASAFDAASGERFYTERIGGNYSASPLYADGRIYLASHEGKVTVIKPGKQLEIVSENDLGEQIMASLIAMDGRLLIRSAEALYCFGD